MLLPCQRQLFDLPDDVVYLNCAYMGPLPRDSARAGEEAVRLKQQPWEIQPKDFFEPVERVRELFAQIIRAETDDIAIVPSASYGLAVAAHNVAVEKDQEILILEDQFPSNVHVWRELALKKGARLKTIRRPKPGSNTGWTAPILDAISERTAVAALPHCHWTDGGLVDLVAVGKKLRAFGAALVLDLTQSAGAWPFDVRKVKPDFVAAAAYKWLLGPYALSFLYAAPHRQEGDPIEYSWMNRARAENFARLVDPRHEYAPGARRFDMGEKAQFQLLPIAEASLDRLLRWEVENIAETLTAMNGAIAERAAALGLSCLPEGLRAGHYLGIDFPHGMPPKLIKRLTERNIHVSLRGKSMRVTPHLYNTEEETGFLMETLEEVL
ncbi:MAG: aminotransferase class V-fold PLP-dependent enzyme [Alphaproteobacteria bacterium]